MDTPVLYKLTKMVLFFVYVHNLTRALTEHAKGTNVQSSLS